MAAAGELKKSNPGDEGCTFGKLIESDLKALEKLCNIRAAEYQLDRTHNQGKFKDLFDRADKIEKERHSLEVRILMRFGKNEIRLAVMMTILSIISSTVTTLLLKVFKVI
jgi:hypothetical protein